MWAAQGEVIPSDGYQYFLQLRSQASQSHSFSLMILPVSAVEGRWAATHMSDNEKKMNLFADWKGQKGGP